MDSATFFSTQGWWYIGCLYIHSIYIIYTLFTLYNVYALGVGVDLDDGAVAHAHLPHTDKARFSKIAETEQQSDSNTQSRND